MVKLFSISYKDIARSFRKDWNSCLRLVRDLILQRHKYVMPCKDSQLSGNKNELYPECNNMN